MGKKVEPNNQFDLLKSLAHKGDPTAFFTIISPYLKKKYLKERLGGKEHKETVKKLIYEAIEYFSEAQKLSEEKFNHYLEENILVSSETTPSAGEEIFNLENEKKIKEQLDAFLIRCHRELLRTTASIKKNKIAKMKKFPQFLYYNRILRAILIVIAFLALFLSVFFIMYWQKLSIKISFVKEKEIFTFSIPYFYSKESIADSANKKIEEIKDSIKTTKNSDTTISVPENKIVKKDNTTTPQITVKKTTVSSTTSPSVSSATSTPQVPQPRRVISSPEQNGVAGTSSQVKSSESTDTSSLRMISPIPSSQSSTLQNTTQPETPSQN